METGNNKTDMRLKSRGLIGAMMATAALLAGCGGGGGGGGGGTTAVNSGMVVKMHDAGASYQSVTITVSEVDAIDSNNNTNVLSTTPQTFNLLSLQNGVTQTIATDPSLAAGTYQAIVVKISSASLVDSNGNTQTVTVPSNFTSPGITVSGSFTVTTSSVTTVSLDFNAAYSIGTTSSSSSSTVSYSLSPVISVTPATTVQTGTVSGTVTDTNGNMLQATAGQTAPSVSLYVAGQSSNAAAAAVQRVNVNLSTGAYSFTNVPVGSYDVVFTAYGYTAATIAAQAVTSGNTTAVATEQLTATGLLPPPAPPLVRRK